MLLSVSWNSWKNVSHFSFSSADIWRPRNSHTFVVRVQLLCAVCNSAVLTSHTSIASQRTWSNIIQQAFLIHGHSLPSFDIFRLSYLYNNKIRHDRQVFLVRKYKQKVVEKACLNLYRSIKDLAYARSLHIIFLIEAPTSMLPLQNPLHPTDLLHTAAVLWHRWKKHGQGQDWPAKTPFPAVAKIGA